MAALCPRSSPRGRSSSSRVLRVCLSPLSRRLWRRVHVRGVDLVRVCRVLGSINCCAAVCACFSTIAKLGYMIDHDASKERYRFPHANTVARISAPAAATTHPVNAPPARRRGVRPAPLQLAIPSANAGPSKPRSRRQARLAFAPTTHVERAVDASADNARGSVTCIACVRLRNAVSQEGEGHDCARRLPARH